MTGLGNTQAKNETPTFAGVLEALVHAKLLEMYTGMPGQIESYDKDKGTVNVQPSIKRKYVKDNEVVNLPIINNVPVCFPRANEAVITFPIKKGDTVWLMFSQRSLERWKTQGGIVEAGDPRHHALSDAVALVGVYPSNNPIQGVDGENLVIRHGNSSKIIVKKNEVEVSVGSGKLTISKDGKFIVGNGAVDLLDILDKVIDEITKLTVPTGVGPSGLPVNSAAFLALKEKLGAIKA